MHQYKNVQKKTVKAKRTTCPPANKLPQAPDYSHGMSDTSDTEPIPNTSSKVVGFEEPHTSDGNLSSVRIESGDATQKSAQSRTVEVTKKNSGKDASRISNITRIEDPAEQSDLEESKDMMYLTQYKLFLKKVTIIPWKEDLVSLMLSVIKSCCKVLKL